jgi:predicted DNA-binding transcriptional regulator YafY
MQTDQLHRIIFINDLIKDSKYPSSLYLAGKLQVNQRTIERDIETMKKEFKAPIKYCRMNKGYNYTEERYFLPPCFS